MTDSEEDEPVELPDHWRVIRVIKRDKIVPVDGEDRFRPESSQFSDSSIDGAMSVFIEERIKNADRDPLDLLEKFPGQLLSVMTVKEYRDLGQLIVDDPRPDFFPGHAAVRDATGRRSAGRKTKLAKGSRWLEGQPSVPGAPRDDSPGSA